MLAWTVFLAGALFTIYVLALYPLLLRWLAKRRTRPLQKDDLLRSVSVLIAVRNGERWMERKLRSVLALDYPRELMEILVVSDGSTDRTAELVRQFSDQGVELLELATGSGKASALNLGMTRARHELLVLTDVRQELEPGSLRKLVACYADPAVGVVSGDLVIRKSDGSSEQDVSLYRRYESWIRDQMSRMDSMFGATGSYYSMRRELARPIPSGTLLDDMHLPLGAFFQGYRLILEPQAIAYDEPTGLEQEFSRKVRTLAGNWQLIARYPALLTPANRMWLHFMSHKFGRLMLPYALLAVGISSFWLPSPWQRIAWIGQALFYLLAVLHPVFPKGSMLARLSSPIRTFVVLMIADLCSIAVVFVPAERLWNPTQLPPREQSPPRDLRR